MPRRDRDRTESRFGRSRLQASIEQASWVVCTMYSSTDYVRSSLDRVAGVCPSRDMRFIIIARGGYKYRESPRSSRKNRGFLSFAVWNLIVKQGSAVPDMVQGYWRVIQKETYKHTSSAS